MNRIIILLLLLAFLYTPALLYPGNSREIATSAFQGTYSYGSTTGTGAYGSAIVYPETDSTILIYLLVNSGEPGFQVSELYRRLKVVDGTAIYTPSGAECNLALKFTNSSLITTVTGDQNHCSLADGLAAEYKKTASEKKEFFKDRNGKKIFFQKNKPK